MRCKRGAAGARSEQPADSDCSRRVGGSGYLRKRVSAIRLDPDSRVARDAPLPKGIHAEVRTLTDPRFFHRGGPFALSAIARHIAAEPPDTASAATIIHDIAPLESAARGHLALFYDARYPAQIHPRKASPINHYPHLPRHAPHHTRQ